MFSNLNAEKEKDSDEDVQYNDLNAENIDLGIGNTRFGKLNRVAAADYGKFDDLQNEMKMLIVKQRDDVDYRTLNTDDYVRFTGEYGMLIKGLFQNVESLMKYFNANDKEQHEREERHRNDGTFQIFRPDIFYQINQLNLHFIMLFEIFFTPDSRSEMFFPPKYTVFFDYLIPSEMKSIGGGALLAILNCDLYTIERIEVPKSEYFQLVAAKQTFKISGHRLYLISYYIPAKIFLPTKGKIQNIDGYKKIPHLFFLVRRKIRKIFRKRRSCSSSIWVNSANQKRSSINGFLLPWFT